MIKRLLLLFLFALPLCAQTIQNPSFETANSMPSSVAGMGAWNSGPIPGWTLTGPGGSFQPTEFASLPNGSIVAWSNGGSIAQDLGVPAQANMIYTLAVSIGHRVGSYGDLASNYTLSLNAGTTNLCTVTANSKTIPASTFAPQALTCPVGATPPAGNLGIVLASAGIQTDFDSVTLTSASAIVPQPQSLTVKAQLLWCTVCNQTDDVAASGSLVIAQTNGPTGTFVIRTDGSISASGIIDIAQDPLEFTFWLIDSTGVAQPGASMKLTFPRFELAGPSFTLGTFSLGVVRIAHTTDNKGNPAVRLASIDQFKLL